MLFGRYPPGLEGPCGDAHLCPQHVERIGDELANFLVAAHHQPEHRCLYTAYRQHTIVTRLSPYQGPGSGQIDAIEPIGTRPGLGRAIESMVVPIVADT